MTLYPNKWMIEFEETIQGDDDRQIPVEKRFPRIYAAFADKTYDSLDGLVEAINEFNIPYSSDVPRIRVGTGDRLMDVHIFDRYAIGGERREPTYLPAGRIVSYTKIPETEKAEQLSLF